MATKRRLKRPRGALTTICVLLLLSALIRLGEHAGSAYAREDDGAAMPPEVATQVVAAAAPPDIAAVLKALQDREDRVKESENQVRLRMVALEEAENEIAERISELRAAEAALRETLALADQAAENDIARLTAVYENMKPKDAAALFETMDATFAAGFLGRMKPAAAAGILAGLEPETAYTISVVLAGRNAEAPKQ